MRPCERQLFGVKSDQTCSGENVSRVLARAKEVVCERRYSVENTYLRIYASKGEILNPESCADIENWRTSPIWGNVPGNFVP